MGLLNWFRNSKSKAPIRIREEKVPEMIKKAQKPGGDAFHEYRANKILPEKYEFGMNCFLDTVQPEIRQAVYEELIKSGGIGTVHESISSFGDTGVPTLFGIKNLSSCLETYNKVAREKKTAFKLDKKDLIRLMLERPDLEPTFLTRGGVSDGGKVIHATTQKISDILLGTEPWLAKGDEFHRKGKHREAIECYDKAIEIEPLDARAWHNKGAILSELGKYKEAVKCEDKVLEIAPNFVHAWLNKAISLDKLEDYKRVVECYDRVLEINPNVDWVWNNKGAILEELGRYKEAVECVDKLIELDESNATRWSKKGGLLCKLKKYNEAIECCDKALEIDPICAEALFFKGLSLKFLGKIKEGLECVNVAINLDTKFVGLLEEWGVKVKKDFSFLR